MTDFTGKTDDELRALRDEILLELEHRAVIASADQRLADLNRRVLDAKGEVDGNDWVQPSSAADAYPKDWTVKRGGKTWVSLTPANVWEPGTSGWREVVDPASPSGPAAWVQPSGATDAYAIGDKVSYNGSVWQSTASANVWAPGVYGWVQV